MYWLPEIPDWSARLREIAISGTCDWAALTGLANARLGFLETIRLDRTVQKLTAGSPPEGAVGKPIRLAVLGSSTMDSLVPGLRVGALRRGMWLTTYVPAYGQYLQDLIDPECGLAAFAPTTVLFALDARHILGEVNVACSAADADVIVDDAITRCRELWRLARSRFKAGIIQQAVMPVFPQLLGHNEHRLPGSRAWLVERINQRLRDAADEESVDLLAIDRLVVRDGVDAWYDPMMWNTAKQEVRPSISHIYGEHVGRIVAAQQGQSFKCLVLDLDNTLWGGVIGDDGLSGIVLGQGSAMGEAFLSLQHFARDLSRRGIILAACSKNDEINALLPFEQHPEMLLTRSDFACFAANWSDKPSNLREIARILNIGIDSLVFADDNPFERELVRRELPMVAVPELPEDPARFVQCLADAGYFESVHITAEDLERSRQYQANAEREALRVSSTDLAGYLGELRMEMEARPFDRVGLQRIVQLINKTNQFNLTTRRYAEADILPLLDDPASVTLQIRLTDRFGDNGIIAILIGRLSKARELEIDTWLMSCRVLGRQVEQATLNVLAAEAARIGAIALIGEYRPTPKNGMVRDHYRKLGFDLLHEDGEGNTFWRLDLTRYVPVQTAIAIASSMETI
ncbi:MAG: HAD family hydrolase [Acetobacteraceae bacterium]|nr:HAD family hydrolase [Acetobacteraceae bacterium]